MSGGRGASLLQGSAVADLVRARTADDRLRARATAAAAAGTGVVLLAAVSVAGLSLRGGRWDVARAVGLDGSLAPRAGLAPFLAQPGLRPGVVVALLLLVLPLAALAAQAVAVGAVAEHRREGAMVLAGAGPADLRRLRVARTRGAFVRGALLAGPLYALAWVVLGLGPTLLGSPLPVRGALLPAPQAWLPLAWLVLVAVLAAVGTALGVRGPTLTSPLGRWRPAPPPGRVLRWGVAAALLLVATTATIFRPLLFQACLLATLVATAGFVRAVVAHRTARRPCARPEHGRRAVTALAAAQRRGSPVAVGTVSAVLVVCGVFFGLGVTQFALSDEDGRTDPFLAAGTALVVAVGVVATTVALASLVLSLVEHLTTARRSVAATAALGADRAVLVAVQARVLVTTAVPAVVAGTLLGALPVVAFSVLGGWNPLTTEVTVAAVTTAAVAGALTWAFALLAARVTARAVGRAASVEHLRSA